MSSYSFFSAVLSNKGAATASPDPPTQRYSTVPLGEQTSNFSPGQFGNLYVHTHTHKRTLSTKKQRYSNGKDVGFLHMATPRKQTGDGEI